MSSGAGLFAQEMVAGMVDAGGDVVFVAPPAQDSRFEAARPGLTRIRSQREKRGGSRISRLFASFARVGSSAIGVARARLKARVFIVSIPDPLIFAVPILALLRLTGARIIYVVHDPRPHFWKLPGSLRWLEDGAYKAAYGLSSALVVLSGSAQAELARAYSVSRKRIAVIEHGVFVLGDPVPLAGSRDLLLFGTLRRNKGIHEAIDGIIAARARGADARLVIAGEPHGPEMDYWRTCEALARAHPEAVELHLGYVPDAALEELVARCDAFLLPYQAFFSQSGVAMVAASNARPVIATRAGGIGDLIDDGLASVVIAQPGGGSEVADAIIAFLATPAGIWNERARQFHARTLESRSWQAIGRHYVTLAQEVDA